MNKRFAIIDIETTGGKAENERITEIAIVVHDGVKIVDKFETLVNPERMIPPYISTLTGITDAMVADAPKFFEVAKKIVQITEGTIFVAHNVRFDYGFVREEFHRLGFVFTRRQLCTVKLSRMAFPGLPSYALGNLIKHFKIPVTDRHRAMADALATTVVFEKILAKNTLFESAETLINKGLKENQLPKSIQMEQLHALPETCGIYYFYNTENEVVYVGKSINIQKRIFEHFADKTNKGDKIQEKVANISFEETGSELVALLLENAEIKRLKPPINKAQRRTNFQYAIFSYTDEKGYRRFWAAKNVTTVRRKNKPLYEFTKLLDAKNYLKSLAKNFTLCENFLEIGEAQAEDVPLKACFNHHIGLCIGACLGKELPEAYNERADQALESLATLFSEDFILLDTGRLASERAVISVRDGHCRGFGYVDIEDSHAPEDLLEAVKSYPTNADADQIVRMFLKRNLGKTKDLKYIKL
jgi:DNA polymerase III subunit epsilon